MSRVVGSIATGSSLTVDMPVGGNEWLTVIGVVGTAASPAALAGDVAVTVQPFLQDASTGAPDNSTLSDLVLAPIDTVAAVFANNRAQTLSRFRVAGLTRVRIFVKNNNAATKPVEADLNLG